MVGLCCCWFEDSNKENPHLQEDRYVLYYQKTTATNNGQFSQLQIFNAWFEPARTASQSPTISKFQFSQQPLDRSLSNLELGSNVEFCQPSWIFRIFYLSLICLNPCMEYSKVLEEIPIVDIKCSLLKCSAHLVPSSNHNQVRKLKACQEYRRHSDYYRIE